MISHYDKVPTLAVGLLTAPEVTINFISGFNISGSVKFTIVNGAVYADGKPSTDRFDPIDDGSVFEVVNVMIGIGFHWQRLENQRFTGAIQLKIDASAIVVINHVPVETYLKSVISSEMSATASESLLKAHAVISRSWVLAQINRQSSSTAKPIVTDDEIIRWYDREDHRLFDVCADDHCQRYQGITRQTTPTVARAVDATCGEVLTADGVLCDARFSKCCGGAMERFSSCWEPRDYKYLRAKADAFDTPLPDLTDEAQARQWILSRPEAFCNTSDASILSQVLNGYDRETADFYRWKVTYTGAQLRQLILSKAGLDLGDIVDLIPLSRGSSARITRLKIVGQLRTIVVGKELEIRRWLSPTHLYSSAFVVDASGEVSSRSFTLHGAGWGHGVGLCQIGAAVMGANGYDYRQILNHYYPQSQITKLY
jgi:SpoIID/LytB domain protein